MSAGLPIPGEVDVKGELLADGQVVEIGSAVVESETKEPARQVWAPRRRDVAASPIISVYAIRKTEHRIEKNPGKLAESERGATAQRSAPTPHIG